MPKNMGTRPNEVGYPRRTDVRVANWAELRVDGILRSSRTLQGEAAVINISDCVPLGEAPGLTAQQLNEIKRRYPDWDVGYRSNLGSPQLIMVPKRRSLDDY